nr:MAG TPA: hypothetical protein [Caudoviricetes sp.]
MLSLFLRLAYFSSHIIEGERIETLRFQSR